MSILVGLMSGKAEVRYRSDIITPQEIAILITGLGFHATVADDGIEKDGSVNLSVSVNGTFGKQLKNLILQCYTTSIDI